MATASSRRSDYKGLYNFIKEIRKTKGKEEEGQRVEEELANIRKNFTGSKTLSVYNRKKYVLKMTYIHLLGYEVDFGHVEVVNLLSASTFSEKSIGYTAASILIHNTDEQIRLIVQSIRNDLQSSKDTFQCLALSAIANIGGAELTESLAPDVQRLLMSRTVFPIVRKRASLCMLRMVRVNPEVLVVEDWADKIVGAFRDARNMGVIISLATLILGLIEKNPKAFEGCLPQAVLLLSQLAVSRTCPPDYVYHTVPSPWLQVQLLRIVAFFPFPEDPTVVARLTEVLTTVLTRTEVTKSINKNNGEHAVLFEVIKIIVKQGEDGQIKLRNLAMKHLARFINIREPNIRYLGLENMSKMAALPETGPAIRKQQAAIMVSLKDADISLRRRALDLLFAMCDTSNAQEIVKELLAYLVVAEFAIKDEMVLKTAILAERYAPNLQWYVDTVLQLIVGSGQHVSDDVWHRAVQIITNNEKLQPYAARKVYNAVANPKANEASIKVAGYTLGEFGYLLNEAGSDEHNPEAVLITGAAQFAALEQHFRKVSPSTRALLLSTFIKMQNLYPELQPAVQAICDRLASDGDAELQQRAVEYRAMPSISSSVMATVLDSMPPFPERESVLEARLKKKGSDVKDKDVWDKETKHEDEEAVLDSSDEEGYDEDEDSGSFAARSGAAAGAGGSVAKTAEPEEDLLGLASTPVPAPAAAPVTAAPPAAAAAAAPTVPVTKRVGLDAEATGKMRGYLRSLATVPAGVLYDDSALSVGVQMQFSGFSGRMMLHFKNKAAVPLTAFKARIPPMAQVKVELKDEVPTSIPVGGQAKCQVTLQAMQPFSDAPQLQVSFISEPGTGHAYPLRLPVFLTHFCEGASLAAADFQSRWGALAAPPKAVSFAVPSSSAAPSLEAAQRVMTSLKVTLIDTPGAPGLCAACSYKTASTYKTGDRISVGCLVQIAPNVASSSYNVAVRTQHPEVSIALKKIIGMLLA